ncbi:MAG TPA: PSD1 and planctomycete cytochrome C domain-containing protein, partial [Gemmataceae bacterium]|nr:PSD1 and planctomycete cytochrome C domain-containing protein [Gemmataceae bacterium]
TRKAKLRLDTQEGAHAVAVVPGKPDKSELLVRLTADDESVMPPPATGKKLTPQQVETLRKWIAGGAEYKSHWSFITPTRPDLPRGVNPIDHLVRAKLKAAGLSPSPEAPKETLLRRVTLDLTGLPPTPVEIDAYLKDTSPQAYEKVVDRLLASPRFGERMALEWLDAARYADTHGYHIDSGRDMTRWRDYVIRSFNENKRFDTFTVEQLAGDLLPNSTLEQKIASGFNRNHMINFEGGAIPAEYLTAYIVDRVNTTATVWLGLTAGCAQCHDHKYDPISQKDYYRLYAFFNNVPENGLDGQKGNAAPVLKVPTAEQEAKLVRLRASVAGFENMLAGPMPDADKAQLAWEKKVPASKTTWNVLGAKEPKSKGGATLAILDDKSVRASGTNPAKETYTVSLSPTGKVTALRLEALPDPSFPDSGPGRSANGNFVMTGVRVTLGGKPVPLRAASASHFQKEGGFDVASILKKGPGWAILPEVGKPSSAVFEFAEPVTAGEGELVLQLEFNSIFTGHQIGRFRVSATDSPTPHGAGGLPAPVAAALAVEPSKRTDKQRADLRAHYRGTASPDAKKLADAVAALKTEIAAVEKAIPDAMVMSEMAKPRDTHILVRGAYDKKGDKVTAGVPLALPPMKAEQPSRLDLARWLVSPEQPLTARVIVNRYWQMYFGNGIVKTSDDFGSQGEWPTHPELLDWLACEFQPKWDIKHIQRLIVTSATYRQSSKVTPAHLAKDPENRLFARSSRLRLPAEFIRDQALAVSGLLNGDIGGKSVSPYQPAGIWEELAFRLDNKNFSAQVYEQSKGRDLYRRTMYTFWKRTAPPPAL